MKDDEINEIYDLIFYYIENADNFSDEEYSKIINDFTIKYYSQLDFEKISIRVLPFYILLMIRIKNVADNEKLLKLVGNIKKYYSKHNVKVGPQCYKWYENNIRISKCIDNTLKELNTNINESRKETLQDLVNMKELTIKNKELSDYVLQFINNENNFVFELYKILEIRRNNKQWTGDTYPVEKYLIQNMNDSTFMKWIHIQFEKFNKTKEEFDNLDEKVAFYIRNNCPEDLIDKILEISLKYGYDFTETKTNGELVYLKIIKNSIKLNEDFFDLYLSIYIDELLFKKNLFSIINADIFKIIEIKDKKTLLDKMIKTYNNIDSSIINEIDEKVKKYRRLTNREKEVFINQLTLSKIKEGIVDYETCKYIVYCMIEYNDFLEIKECILCDLAINIEFNNNIYNCMVYIENEDNMYWLNGINKHKNVIFLNEKIVNTFSKKDLRILGTIFHEIEHSIQNKRILQKEYTGNTYKMFIERCLAHEIKDYNIYNYYTKYNEIEARKAEAKEIQKFLKSIGIDLNKAYIEGKSVNEYCTNLISECDNLLLEADTVKISESETRNIMELWENYKEKYE